MQNVRVALTHLVDFRVGVYATFSFRYDALFELVDALSWCPVICSAVEDSQCPVFRRRLARMYDALTNGKIGPGLPRQV